jgi:predicted DsbA family dithiol-disulfide isomerase
LTVELGENVPWALSVEKRRLDGPVKNVDPDFGDEPYASLAMNAGDAVMYRGVNHRHGRIEPNPNTWSAHLFLHWVEAEGAYAGHAFDRAKIEASRAR